MLRVFCEPPTMHTRALTIHGAAGIGKTALWRSGLDVCRGLGHAVLVARGAMEEMSEPLVTLTDLFEGVDPPTQVLASDTDPIERGRAVLDTLRELSNRSPVIVAIDDAQWIDAVTARSLRYTLRRLDGEPIGVLVTSRRGEGGDRLNLASSLPPGRATTVDVGPLSPAELRRLLRTAVAAISPLTFRKVYEVSGGNPLYAIELTRSLRSEERALGIAASFPLPDSLQAVIAARLGQVAGDVLTLIRFASALGPTPLAQLARVLPLTDVEASLGEAEKLDILVVDPDLRVRFAHPLVGSAVYEGMNRLERRALHGHIAAQLDDPDARARHLALSVDAADGEAADALEAAALRAAERGASDLAAELAHHSRRITPGDDQGAANRRALLEVTNVASAGDARRARALIDELAAALPPGPVRAEALIQRFYVENDDVELGDATLLQAFEDSEGHAALRGRVLDIIGWFRGIYRGELARGIQCATKALELAEATHDRRLEMLAGAHLAHMEAMTGKPDTEAMAESIAMASDIGEPALGGGPRAWLAKQRSWAGDLDAAEAAFTELIEALPVTGNELERPYRLYDLALVACARGDFAAAWDHVEAGVTAARDTENSDAEGWMLYPKALVEAWLGETTALETAEQMLTWPGRPSHRLGSARAKAVIGLLAYSRGDTQRAADVLDEAYAAADEMGVRHPGAVPALTDAVIALAAAGRSEEAAAVHDAISGAVASMQEERPSAMLAHAVGVLSLARGEPEDAEESLGAAVAAFDRLGLRPDAARAKLCQGQALLRGGKRTAAAEALSEARQRFFELGAELWVQRAAEDLDRAQPRRVDGMLTTTEAKIAELVAGGARNREIAAALYVSVATVEAHLTRIYRKLEIRSRTELARLVHDGAVSVAVGEAP